MAEYHVGCGLTAIYAGTINKAGTKWVNKSNVTHEAICAAAQFLLEHEKSLCFTHEGKRYKLTVIESEE